MKKADLDIDVMELVEGMETIAGVLARRLQALGVECPDMQAALDYAAKYSDRLALADRATIESLGK